MSFASTIETNISGSWSLYTLGSIILSFHHQSLPTSLFNSDTVTTNPFAIHLLNSLPSLIGSLKLYKSMGISQINILDLPMFFKLFLKVLSLYFLAKSTNINLPAHNFNIDSKNIKSAWNIYIYIYILKYMIFFFLQY